jgi:anti-sigma-K factor RskA
MNNNHNSKHEWINELLPEYANGNLGAEQRRQVEFHIQECGECQEELAFWRLVSGEIQDQNRSLQAPAGIAQRVLSSSRESVRTSFFSSDQATNFRQRLNHAWLLLQSQTPLVRREIWPASAAVLLIGFAVTILSGQWRFLGVVAPLVAAGAIAALYGAENDPALELSLATPTSQRQILMARVVLVFSYNLVLALIANLALIPFNTSLLPGSLILEWLGPMAFLSGAALLLSLWVGTGSAVTITYLAWLGQLVAQNILRNPGVIGTPTPVLFEVLAGYLRFWADPALLLPLGLLLFIIALWRVGRQEANLKLII